MKFQPGQSGNPAGRPLGARNKKTIAREEALAERAEKVVDGIVILAERGHAAAMRICAEWMRPGGNSRALALELPRITCADDAQKALDTVIEAFGDGGITVREFPTMLGSVDRMARVAQRIDAMREKENERYAKLRVHGVHPDMIPKPPPGWSDPMEDFLAAIERGEDPDDPGPSADDAIDERLYSPVNSDDEAASLPRERSERGEGGDPGLDPGEPGGGAAGTEDEALYSPVNSDAGAAEEERSEAAAEVSGFPSPHAKRGGEGSGVGGDVRSEQQIVFPPGTADAAPPSLASGREMGDRDGLYFPVNSGAELSPGGGDVAAPIAETASEASDPGVTIICCSERAVPPTPDPSPPFAARMGGGEPAGLDLNPG